MRLISSNHARDVASGALSVRCMMSLSAETNGLFRLRNHGRDAGHVIKTVDLCNLKEYMQLKLNGLM